MNFTIFLLLAILVVNNSVRDRSLIMGAVAEKRGAASTIFAWIGSGLKLKNM
jgi:hypothetical protein